MSVTPEEEQQLDAILDDIDQTVERVIKKCETRKLRKGTPINGSALKKTRMEFRQLADTKITNEDGDDIVLDEDDMLYVPDYVPMLEKTKKGETKNWAMHFQGNLHKISEADYKLIEKDMKTAAKPKRRAKAKAKA